MRQRAAASLCSQDPRVEEVVKERESFGASLSLLGTPVPPPYPTLEFYRVIKDR